MASFQKYSIVCNSPVRENIVLCQDFEITFWTLTSGTFTLAFNIVHTHKHVGLVTSSNHWPLICCLAASNCKLTRTNRQSCCLRTSGATGICKRDGGLEVKEGDAGWVSTLKAPITVVKYRSFWRLLRTIRQNTETTIKRLKMLLYYLHRPIWFRTS